MAYRLEADAISLMKLRTIFSDACISENVPISTYQATAILSKFIDGAKVAGVLVELQKTEKGGTLQVVTHRLPGAVIKELDRITAEDRYYSRSELIREMVVLSLSSRTTEKGGH